MPIQPITNPRAMAKQIETWLTDKLIPFARNPRTHSNELIAQIAASIQEFGFNNRSWWIRRRASSPAMAGS
jgi:hypothetical protein